MTFVAADGVVLLDGAMPIEFADSLDNDAWRRILGALESAITR